MIYTRQISPSIHSLLLSLKPDGSVLSFGAGVEREALFTAFSFFKASQGAWFLTRFDNRASIATTMSLSGSAFISPDRRQGLRVLGCLSALLLIYGIAPEPLSPAVFQLAANNFDLRSLTPEFVGEWFPSLRDLLEAWKSMGPEGDLAPFQSHFVTFHDMQVWSI